MNVTNHHIEHLVTCEIDDKEYELFVDFQQIDNGGWTAYFYFKLDDWESLRQPSWGYGGKTWEEALEECGNIAADDMEYLIGALL